MTAPDRPPGGVPDLTPDPNPALGGSRVSGSRHQQAQGVPSPTRQWPGSPGSLWDMQQPGPLLALLALLAQNLGVCVPKPDHHWDTRPHPAPATASFRASSHSSRRKRGHSLGESVALNGSPQCWSQESCDHVIYNKKYIFGLHPGTGTELLKPLGFPK